MLNRTVIKSFPRQEFYRENDNVYFNAAITHNDAISNVNPAIPSIGMQPVLAKYEVNNDTPFIDNAEEYYCSVVRFDIPLNAVPLFICPIIPNQGDPNLTPLIIGIQINGVNHPVYLEYLNSRSTNLLPPLQNLDVQIITPYYYVYSYQLLLDMINTGLLASWIDAGQVAADAPYFYLDAPTGLIQLVVPPALLPQVSPAPALYIYMNTALANYLGAFSTIFNGYNQPDGKDYTFVLTPLTSLKANNNYPEAGTNWAKFSQEYSTLPLWASIRKIVILSSKLPIVAESVSTGDTQSSRQTILTDFVPIINNAGDSKQIAYYLPSGQYRLSDMIGSYPVQSFGLQFYWQDTTDNLYPIEITIYQQINIKLAFLRKDLYKKPIPF